MSLYYNIPVKTTTKAYNVQVYTADGFLYEYLVNANSAKEAQGIGYRKTFENYAEMGLKENFHPTKILANSQNFLAI